MVSESSVVPAQSVDVNWATVTTWEDALRVFPEVIPASVAFGDGSVLIDNKKSLVDTEFVILDWHFITDATTQREYVNVLIMNRSGAKGRFNDGSTGIMQQCRDYEEATGRRGGIYCHRGLRMSEYTYENDKGEVIPARTFYFDN